ncbi:arsenate reductase ArsC [Zunongwangia pacifica]|uniref:Arsenate reductase ArsC n=1 Tax=Zunongwangia pacifica TaxID=2911062 RepID=A0A9X1ZYD2_9FLAO|nr:arsenate reductase ArsC [Zunongwangia pacifica]MCL6216679.1 arsenate reductase ArsC [Zunongwangia pacifica]
MKNILVLCTGNSCRSQIAHGYLNYFAYKKANVYSAGIDKHGVNPHAIVTMQEDGINIEAHTSNLIEEYKDIDFDYIISVCDHAKDHCPVDFSSKAVRIHQHFKDPSAVKGNSRQIHEAFEATRQGIKDFCRAFVKQYL